MIRIIGKVSPRRALFDVYAYGPTAIATGLLFLYALYAGLSDAHLHYPDRMPWSLIGAILLSAPFFILIIGLFFDMEKKAMADLSYGYLVLRWKKVTNYPASHFPINAVGCASLRKKYFIEKLTCKGLTANLHLNNRKLSKDSLERLKKNRPQYVVEQVNNPEKEFFRREAHAKTRKEYDKTLAEYQHDYNQLEERAETHHREYLAWWDLAKNLGGFYGTNLLPIDPETQKPFEKKSGRDAPTRYRESLENPAPDNPTATSGDGEQGKTISHGSGVTEGD